MNKPTQECFNIVLNLFSGLLPEMLTKDEVEILEKEYGKNWFHILGYNEDEYNKPDFKE